MSDPRRVLPATTHDMDFFFVEQLGAPLWLWLLFLTLLTALLSFDLGVLEKRSREINAKESVLLSTVYIGLGLAFGAVVWWRLGADAGLSYLTGFIVEKSLSLDNIFVISMIFLRFSIPSAYRHRVLFWGVLFAILLRGVMIAFGAALVSNFGWTLYFFSAVLIVTGVRTLIHPSERAPKAENALIRFVRSKFNVTDQMYGKRFFVRLFDPATKKSALFATPLFLALIAIELADVIFAVDSVPAIFAITTDPFVVYTSNIFAILGLRALFFALSAVMQRFRYLEPTLALVLIFIGSKIFIADFIGEEIPAWASLAGSAGIIMAGGLYGLWRTQPGVRKWTLRAAAAGGLAALALGVGLLGWPSRRDATTGYVTQAVERGPVTRTVTLAGRIDPVPPERVGAAAPGIIVEVSCSKGDKVKAGQVCASLDQRPYRLRIDRERAALAAAKARLDKSKARLEAVTTGKRKTARAARDQAQARFARDEARVAQRREALAAAKAALAATQIRAPIDGMIVSSEAAIGRETERAKPLFLVAPTNVRAVAEATTQETAEVEIGDKASVALESRPDRAFFGRVERVERSSTPENKSQSRVIVGADGSLPELDGGGGVSIEIEVDRREDVLRAPKRALDYSERTTGERDAPPGWTQVWVLRDDEPVRVAIRLGLDGGAYAEIVEGDLRPGDRLILGKEDRPPV
jgi:tellurite resistance protein TerC